MQVDMSAPLVLMKSKKVMNVMSSFDNIFRDSSERGGRYF